MTAQSPSREEAAGTKVQNEPTAGRRNERQDAKVAKKGGTRVRCRLAICQNEPTKRTTGFPTRGRSYSNAASCSGRVSLRTASHGLRNPWYGKEAGACTSRFGKTKPKWSWAVSAAAIVLRGKRSRREPACHPERSEGSRSRESCSLPIRMG